jgi:hypothetical protein
MFLTFNDFKRFNGGVSRISFRKEDILFFKENPTHQTTLITLKGGQDTVEVDIPFEECQRKLEE